MAEVNISINGRKFGIACDDGQEQRVIELSNFVDGRVKDMAQSGAGTNESHLLVLSSLLMADELFDLKEENSSNAGNKTPLGTLQITKADEGEITGALDQMADRIDSLAGNLQKL